MYKRRWTKAILRTIETMQWSSSTDGQKLTTRVCAEQNSTGRKRNPQSRLQRVLGCGRGRFITRRAAAAICTCRTPWPLAPGPPARRSSRLWRRTPRCSRSPRPSPWTAPGPWRTASLLPCIFPAFAATHLTKEPCTQWGTSQVTDLRNSLPMLCVCLPVQVTEAWNWNSSRGW